jgi:hypothetical protein
VAIRCRHKRRLLAVATLLLVGYVSVHAAYVYRVRRDTPFLRGYPTYGGWCPPADWDTCSLDRRLHHAWWLVGR